MLHIFVDADGCPVKEEIYRVAARYGMGVTVVANRPLRVPDTPLVVLRVVGNAPDEADDWIAAHAGVGDVVITPDLPLAARCIELGTRVLGPRGREHTADTIGEALAGRALSDQLRQMGVITSGPPPMEKRSRSRFLSRLDEIICALRRQHGPGGRTSDNQATPGKLANTLVFEGDIVSPLGEDDWKAAL